MQTLVYIHLGNSGSGLPAGQYSGCLYLWAVALLSELHTYINLIASLEESSRHTHTHMYAHTHTQTHADTHTQERTHRG